MIERLLARLDGKRDELVGLSRDLVRVPTVNPPGDAYAPSAELLGDRLRRPGFEVRFVRGEGAPGDSARYPRTNVLARWESGRPGPCVHFNGHLDVVPAGQGWTVDPWAGEVRDGRLRRGATRRLTSAWRRPPPTPPAPRSARTTRAPASVPSRARSRAGSGRPPRST